LDSRLESLLQVIQSFETLNRRDWLDGANNKRREGIGYFLNSEKDETEKICIRLKEIDELIESTPFKSKWSREEVVIAGDIAKRLRYPVLLEKVHSIEFALELRNSNYFSERFPRIEFLLLQAVGGGALERENHDSKGYHFHYLDGKKYDRTDVLLTFDPADFRIWDGLFWDHHGKGRHANPPNWGVRRIHAVFDAAKPSLVKPGRRFFLHPSKSSRPLSHAKNSMM
jgi:hypothetical protein